jgi:hypothetical protein
MITNSDKRLKFAREVGIRNFEQQDYLNKRMIIVNHGKTKVLENQTYPKYYELMVNKTNLSLGDLRNLSLELVPLNSIYVIWDDDDIRTPNYISYLVDKLLKERAFAIFIKYRIEYILPTGYSYIHKFENGTTHIMSWKLDKLRYLDLNTLEDVNLQDDLSRFHKKYIRLDNDPKMYLRVNHGSNTSPFALPNRTSISPNNPLSMYKEYEISPEDKAYADAMIKKYIIV